MADAITFRPDEDASRALAVLTRDGTPISAAVRTALIEAARRKAAAAIRAEAEDLAADQQDRVQASRHEDAACVVRSSAATIDMACNADIHIGPGRKLSPGG
jgi:hypothetical protein